MVPRISVRKNSSKGRDGGKEKIKVPLLVVSGWGVGAEGWGQGRAVRNLKIFRLKKCNFEMAPFY